MDREKVEEALNEDSPRSELIGSFMGGHPLEVVEALVIWSHHPDCPAYLVDEIRQLRKHLQHVEEFKFKDEKDKEAYLEFKDERAYLRAELDGAKFNKELAQESRDSFRKMFLEYSEKFEKAQRGISVLKGMNLILFFITLVTLYFGVFK